jgi:radical S-adenosyl methionine domain-containing protein 2
MNNIIPTINYHLLKACNMKCKFCYATFADIHNKRVSAEQYFLLLEKLAESKMFKKINFAGGEPTLIPHICELIYFAKSLGFETSIVTNASKINFDWLAKLQSVLDIITISIDSIDDATNINSGRHIANKTIANEHLLSLSQAAHSFGINLKINTVVSQFNADEVLTDFINQLNPFRWKVLQVSQVEGQNDSSFDTLNIDSKTFDDFCTKNTQKLDSHIKFVKESSSLIQGSYLMIDQLGRFYDSAGGRHNYSVPILSVGVENALKNIHTDFNKFLNRDGLYSTIPIAATY